MTTAPRSRLHFTVLLIIVIAVAVAVARRGYPPEPAQRAAAPAPTLRAEDLFDDTTLHDVWIRISAKDLQQLRDHVLDNTYYKAALEWRGLSVGEIGIRSRGGATRNPTKPGFLLDFNRYRKDQQFLGLTSLVLDNAWYDETMLHDRASMQLFRRMSVPAPRQAHARLYLGDAREPAGVYALVEDVDEAFLQRNFQEHNGHLFEFERIDGYHFEDLGDSPVEYQKRFKPKDHADEPAATVFGPVREMVRTINTAAPEQMTTALAPYLDIDRFLTFLAVTNYLTVWDSFIGEIGMANFYLYRFAGTTRSELIPWDQDNSFTALDWPPTWGGFTKNVLTRTLWAHPATREKYLQTLLDVAARADGWLEQEVDREYRQIRTAVRDDQLKQFTNDQFEARILEMKWFAKTRSMHVRELVAKARAQ